MKKSLQRAIYLLALLTCTMQAQANPIEKESESSNEKLIDNIAFRFMLRSQAKGSFHDEESSAGFSLTPAMIQASFDMGKKFSFTTRYRFDFPATIQVDKTPISLLICNLAYKPTDEWSIVAGKQLMLQGSREFEYCPIEVFYYSSLGGDHMQAFNTGISAYYTKNQQTYAAQITQVVDENFIWQDRTAWNGTLYYAGSIGKGFYEPIFSYTYTLAGAGKGLNSVMLGNRFNMHPFMLELDLMFHESFRYYANQSRDASTQKETHEHALICFGEYTFPDNRFQLGAKYAYDTRYLVKEKTQLVDQQTFSLQFRYALSQRYGIKLHATAAYQHTNSHTDYAYLFPVKNQGMYSAGFTWDFTYRPGKKH
ncbi:MAG: hypothetical protein ACRC3Z_05800 [Phocaeicola sp.]